MNTNFYSLWCNPTGNQTRVDCFSRRRSASTRPLIGLVYSLPFLLKLWHRFVEFSLNRLSLVSYLDTQTPYRDRRTPTLYYWKSKIPFWFFRFKFLAITAWRQARPPCQMAHGTTSLLLGTIPWRLCG